VPLRYPPFAASTDLQQAALNNPALKRGARGPAVALLQGGLIELGHPLPISTKKTGAPDGSFGNETYEALKDFQKRQKAPPNHPEAFKPDGAAGHYTIMRMDALLLALHPTPHVPPPSPPPPPLSAHYQLGSADPATSHDAGAGTWNSKPTTATSLALKLAILDTLPSATVLIGDDAVINMLQYLGNSGRTISIDLEGMVKEVPSAKERCEAEVAQAQAFVEKLPAGTHEIPRACPRVATTIKRRTGTGSLPSAATAPGARARRA
jgi:peptidoglycan hydrolase-like protein with peptidoglycan-binding domain